MIVNDVKHDDATCSVVVAAAAVMIVPIVDAIGGVRTSQIHSYHYLNLESMNDLRYLPIASNVEPPYPVECRLRW